MITGTAVDVQRVLEAAGSFTTTEYASLTRSGAPITWPVTPYRGAHGTLDVTTGLTYPLKAERARNDRRVALSFSDSLGSGLDDPPVVLVQGLATVHDADLLANSARYLREGRERFPDAYARMPTWLLRRMAWYWTRMYVEVTPLKVWWWPDGRLDEPPLRWEAPVGTAAPPSDPPAAGVAPGSWSRPRRQRRDRIDGVLEQLGLPVLTTVGSDGWPVPVRTRAARRTSDGFAVVAPAGVDVRPGPAALTFHRHDARMTTQTNASYVGSAEPADGAVHVRIERTLTDWSLPANPMLSAIGFARAGRRLRRRLETEARRRGQRLPTWDEVNALAAGPPHG